MRGKVLNNSGLRPNAGSPPPMRGKVRVSNVTLYRSRITPAHAGKSSRPTAPLCTCRDHPRPCGEKHIARITMFVDIGSPPPMRGKALKWTHIRIDTGITPAHAGKSFSGDSGAAGREDHPRPCGEKRPAFRQCGRYQGSPPPMRGKARSRSPPRP